MANRTNDDGPSLGAFMVYVDLHSSMLGNQSGSKLGATSTVVPWGRQVTFIRTVVPGTEGRRLAAVTTTHSPA